MDKSVPLDIRLNKLMEHAESKSLTLFEFVKDIIEDEVSRIESVSFHGAYLDPKALDVALEYFVGCGLGELLVRILYSDKLIKTLGKSVIRREHGLLINHDYLTWLKLRPLFPRHRNVLLDFGERMFEEKYILCVGAISIDFTCVKTSK